MIYLGYICCISWSKLNFLNLCPNMSKLILTYIYNIIYIYILITLKAKQLFDKTFIAQVPNYPFGTFPPGNVGPVA